MVRGLVAGRCGFEFHYQLPLVIKATILNYRIFPVKFLSAFSPLVIIRDNKSIRNEKAKLITATVKLCVVDVWRFCASDFSVGPRSILVCDRRLLIIFLSDAYLVCFSLGPLFFFFFWLVWFKKKKLRGSLFGFISFCWYLLLFYLLFYLLLFFCVFFCFFVFVCL